MGGVEDLTTDSQPQGDRLKAAVRGLASELRTKIETDQHGVGTFSDHALGRVIEQLEQLDRTLSWEESLSRLGGTIGEMTAGLQRLQLLLRRRTQGRFVDYRTRGDAVPAGLHGSSDLPYFDMVMSQGAFDCMHWKGMPLFKTVYDFSLYSMMLWDLRPKTILELGSGTGASAVWLADLAAMFGVASHVYSVDLKAPDLRHSSVTFIQGDCRSIEDVFDEALLHGAGHPWLVIEDAHVNVGGVLQHLHQYLVPGDYLVVEDSAGKQADLSQFLSRQPDAYRVDTHYTDFFGRNVTCAQDSILVRV